ncbi:MAG: hypothetical protein JO104_00845 [Candidatus Eremiobacteraeota bacterium]|nr:hypothetical protein [Candidatus Eremiobacteraeota bacterium]
MTQTEASLLGGWSSFYVMIGSSAAALTGLMFVVISVVTGMERTARTRDGVSVFSTPTVVHFCAALFVSAVLVAPWRSLLPPALVIALAGLYGIVYLTRIFFLTRRMTGYTPDAEDWSWYTILPFVATVVIFAGSLALPVAEAQALYAIAAGVVLLIFIGIHNAWDVVTFLAVRRDDLP